MTSPPQYGVTGPLSEAFPTESDVVLSENLHRSLETCGVFETKEESQIREEVLARLDVIVKDWVRRVSLRKGIPQELASKIGAKIFTFGSYRLGVHSPGSDIDTLCVGPRHIDHREFFESLPELLSKQDGVTEMQAIPDAYVPVLKMKVSGISVDLVYARLAHATIAEDLDILGEENLRNIDEQSARSLNGPRVADLILRLVPNVDNFRLTLHAIKHWARERGIFGNIYGYLGGVQWAILVARICQMYPNFAPSMLVSRFFAIFSRWDWASHPIVLKKVEESIAAAGMNFPVWNFNLPSDRRPLMIITPAYPSMNSTFNVSRSTLSIICSEITRARSICERIVGGSVGAGWSELFQPTEFFTMYRHYLQLVISAANPVDHEIWIGYIRSRIRKFVYNLERIDGLTVHLHPELVYASAPAPPHIASLYFGLHSARGGTVDLGPAFDDFEKKEIFSGPVLAWKTEAMFPPVVLHKTRKQIPVSLRAKRAPARTRSSPDPPTIISPSSATSASPKDFSPISFTPITEISGCGQQQSKSKQSRTRLSSKTPSPSPPPFSARSSSSPLQQEDPQKVLLDRSLGALTTRAPSAC